jgi:sugar/nucleoside kinase (ribokinase family)
VDVIGIGTPCFDILARISKLPKENQGATIQEYSFQGGGKVPTAIITLARLGARCGMVGTVGGCSYGEFCLNDFKRHGIDTSKIMIDQTGETPFSIVLADEQTHGRSIMYHEGTARSIEMNDLDKKYIQSARYLHLCDASPETIQAAKWAREKGTCVVYDADYQPGLDKILPLIDVFIASEFYYKAVFQDKDYERNSKKMQDMGPDTVVITLGERGCVGIKGNRFFSEEGFHVEVKDTTGAGDVYHGAFIYGLLHNWDIQKTARFANAVAAIKCTRVGGRAGIPSLKTVIHYLETGEIDYDEIDKRVKLYSDRSLQNVLRM